MMILAEVISDMNSNYENRKHGGYSQIGNMQKKLFEAFPMVGSENIFASDVYLPVGQKIEPGSLESLREIVAEYDMSVIMNKNAKTRN